MIRILICLFLCAGSRVLEAQATEGPHRRMRELMETLGGGRKGEPASFFPTEGDWTWVHTTHRRFAEPRVGVWRFRASETARAMRQCGPLWRSFLFRPEGQPIGSILSLSWERERPWRYVGRNRFVPRGPSHYVGRGAPPSAAFVEWRRERGRWVIAAFGDESYAGPRLLGTVLSDVMREPRQPPPPEPRYAGPTRWYQENAPISFEGPRYIKYGRPRPLPPRDLEPIGWHGHVRVYAQRGQARSPSILYVPVDPENYQPYESPGVDECA
jgi:hypothetical protein